MEWNTGKPDEVIPSVNSTATGAVVATCPKVPAGMTSGWKWVPDEAGKVAAYGECVMDLTHGKTSLEPQFQPLSVSRTTIFGQVSGRLYAVAPGARPTILPDGTARPWAIAGGHAIVVHASVLYALDKK